MEIYKFEQPLSVEIVGDIHGEFEVFFYSIKHAKNMLFIIAGDVGIGFEKPLHYENILNQKLKKLEMNNIFVYCVRGNHDDPSYFNEKKINYNNFKTIPDYSVIQVNNENILCVGGGLSIDRVYRKKNDLYLNRFGSNKKSYWEDELPIYDEAKLNEITNEINIDYVVSHSSPFEFYPLTKEGIIERFKIDDYLENDYHLERNNLSKILNFLINTKYPLKTWFYGHYHTNNTGEYFNITTEAIRGTIGKHDKIYTKTLKY